MTSTCHGPLRQPMVPKSRPMSQIASAHAAQQPLGVVGPRRGGEVEVVVRPAEHRVAHRAADQRELVAGVREQRAEVVDDRRDPVQLDVRVALELDHGQRGGARVRTRGSTLGRRGASRPGPGRTAARPNLYACSAGCRSVLPWRRWRSPVLLAGPAHADPGGTPATTRPPGPAAQVAAAVARRARRR